MISLNQIKDEYPLQEQDFPEEILREYLQYKTLQGIFEGLEADQLSFIGGTAIRIIFSSDRFSEDIDFDNFGLSWDNFKLMMERTRTFLVLDGFNVEMTYKKKGAFHCNVRFPNLLAEYGLPQQRDQKIRIRIDTTQQGVNYEPELRLLNKFDVFTGIRVTPIDILLSMKIIASLTRKRPKGRDFFDISFLLGRTKPNYSFLEQIKGISNSDMLRNVMLQRIAAFDFIKLGNEVQPFLIRKGDVKRVQLFKEYWLQAEL
jgi:predicted nucleotidyltransferase component of viral defense system